jgi:RimJ/RimL family protein N-acetyltransferase
VSDSQPPGGAAALPTLRGERVVLRLPVPTDVAARVAVPRDPEEHRMYGGSGEPKAFSPAEVEEMLASLQRQDLASGRRFVVAALDWPDGRPVDEPDGRYVGGIRLHHISWADRKARLAIGIFDRRFWSRGYGTEAVRLLLRYAFDDLGLHRVDLRVLAYNARAIRCYEKCGFVREGVERESACVDGAWEDDVMMAILESEYRRQPW